MLLLMAFLTVPLAVSAPPTEAHPGYYNCHNKNPCTGETGKNPSLLPYEGDATKYVECSVYRCFERNCGLGTVFSWIGQTCGYDLGPSPNQPESGVFPNQPLSQEPQVQSEVVCEGNNTVLSCPEGKVIKISRTMYGRLSSTVCPHETVNEANTYNCSDENSTVVSQLCDDNQQCTIAVNNTFFQGDPCVGIFKYLEVFYECTKNSTTDTNQPLVQEPRGQRKVVCEGDEMVLSCPEGKVIKLNWSKYGRFNDTECPHETIEENAIYSCSAEVFTVVSQRCYYFQQCKIPVNNSLVSLEIDPCPGLYKYLEVYYECTEPCADLDSREKKFLDCQEEHEPFPPTSRNRNLCPLTKEWVSCSLPLLGSCPVMTDYFRWIVKPLLERIIPICGDEVGIPSYLMEMPIRDVECSYENICLLKFHVELKAAGLEGISGLQLFRHNGTICRYRLTSQIDFGAWFECAARASFKCGRHDLFAGILRIVMDMSITDSILLISSIAEYILKAIGAWTDEWIYAASWNSFIEHLCNPACPEVIPTVIRTFPECYWLDVSGCSDLEAATNCTMEYLPSCPLVPELVRFVSENVLGLQSCA